MRQGAPPHPRPDGIPLPEPDPLAAGWRGRWRRVAGAASRALEVAEHWGAWVVMTRAARGARGVPVDLGGGKMAKLPDDLARRIPPGQALTTKWPVLTYGETPRFDPRTWTFRCFGLVEEEVRWTWEEFLRLPRAEIACDIHCVTRWSRLDNRFEGVPIREIMRRVRLKPGASAVMVHADPDYTTNLSLDELLADDVLLALGHDGAPLTPDHGGPLRLVVPRLYFWKSAKWLRAFEFLDLNAPGFWEQNGYHLRADPWKDERYSDQETHAMQKMRAEAARKLGSGG